jgi:hypothetical protein
MLSIDGGLQCLVNLGLIYFGHLEKEECSFLRRKHLLAWPEPAVEQLK